MTVGVLLAGGRSQRMGGGDKCLRMLGTRSLLDHCLNRAQPQVSQLLLSVNRDSARFTAYGLEIVPDNPAPYWGPLGGILSALEWTRAQHPQSAYVASFACDTPFFPLDLVERLHAALDATGARIAIAASGGRLHPVFGLWPTALAEELRQALLVQGVRKLGDWLQAYAITPVAIEAPAAGVDPFFNINRLEDLQAARDIYCN